MLDEIGLSAEAGLIFPGQNSLIFAVWQQFPGVLIVPHAQVDDCRQLFYVVTIRNRGQNFDTSVQISPHQVGASDESLGLAAVLKCVNSAVF